MPFLHFLDDSDYTWEMGCHYSQKQWHVIVDACQTLNHWWSTPAEWW